MNDSLLFVLVDGDDDAMLLIVHFFWCTQARLSLINASYANSADRQIGIDVENDLLRRSPPLSELLLSMLKSNGISCASL